MDINQSRSCDATSWRRSWDAGQRYLAAGLYTAARRALEAAEAAVFARRDAASLERIYLPLLEACRQTRLQACEGVIVIADPRRSNLSPAARAVAKSSAAATLLMAGPRAVKMAMGVNRSARGRGLPQEALVWMCGGKTVRICSTGAMRFCCGVEVELTDRLGEKISPRQLDRRIAVLPVPGVYPPGAAGHRLASETLLVAWEWLALRWQSRHRVRARPWEELAWLRAARRVDPACEPVMMRMVEICRLLTSLPDGH